MFKWIGAVVTYIAFDSVFLALLGFFIGSVIDHMIKARLGVANSSASAQRQQVFLTTVFILMGKIAKADGRVSGSEIAQVEAFMKEIGMTGANRDKAIENFKLGTNPNFDIDDTIGLFRKYCGQARNLNQVLIASLCALALSDGSFDYSEHALLESIALKLGYSHSQFQRLLEMIMAQQRFSEDQYQGEGYQNATNQNVDIEAAYNALGVNKNSSDQEIKRSYRKLIGQYHPDRLIGQGLPEDMIKVANDKTYEIKKSYNLIKKVRESKR